MADTNQNLVTFRLTWTLSISWSSVTISNDILRNTAIAITDASIVLTNEAKTSFELVVWTIATWTLTLSKRWVTQAQTLTEDANLKKEWRPWTIGYVTLFSSDTLDIDVAWWLATIKNDITFTWDNTFSWTNDFDAWVTINDTFKIPTFADTTARDAVYTAPVSWDKCIITGTWEQYYDGWIWNTLWVWTPTPDATQTVSGKIELATDAEVTAWTATWWTWASLVLTPVQQKKSISLKASATNVDFWATDEFVFNDWWTDKRITKDETRIAMAWSTTLQWTWEMWTDAELVTGTSETLVPNLKQVKTLFDIVVATRDITAASWTVTYNHSLWKIPRAILTHWWFWWAGLDWNTFNWAWDWTNNKISYIAPAVQWWWGAWTSSSIYMVIDSWYTQSGVIQNVTTTTFDVAYTRWWTASWTWNWAITFILIF